MVENLIDIQNNVIPDKFKEPTTGALKTQDLLKSYQELERKMGSMVRIPSEDASEEERRKFYRALGVPETPDAYKIEIKHKLLGSDPQVNQKLYEMGFTNKQVQAVYDLAAEKILPVIEELAQEYEADKQRASLIAHFGGEENWNEVCRQLSAWASQNVSSDVLEALSTTYEGVMTLYKMMQSGEPALMRGGASAQNEFLDEEGLKKLVMSPQYWKDQDPAVLKKVSDGFKRLYPSKR